MDKKILIIMNDLGSGGSERVSLLLAGYLQENGWKVTLAPIKNLRREYCAPLPFPVENLEKQAGGKKNKLLRAVVLRRITKSIQPDLILSLSLSGAYLLLVTGLMRKYRVVLSQRNDPRRDVTGRLHVYLRNCAYARAKRVVFQTKEAFQYFDKQIQAKGRIIPNPLKDGLPEWDETNHKKIIINFCRLSRQKNLPLLVDAFDKLYERYPDYELHIYGRGEEKENLQRYISRKKAGNAIHLNDFCKEIHSVVKESAMFVSSSDYEGISNSMLEALAIGIPVISTDCPCGGAKQYIKTGKNGILTPVNDETALAAAMEYMIKNPEEAKKMGGEAKKIKEELSWEKTGKIWLDIIGESIK